MIGSMLYTLLPIIFFIPYRKNTPLWLLNMVRNGVFITYLIIEVIRHLIHSVCYFSMATWMDGVMYIISFCKRNASYYPIIIW